ncbi:unnamed protein product [Effrenium voratum]|nr:unnamed protein product [Effrenium voratum]
MDEAPRARALVLQAWNSRLALALEGKRLPPPPAEAHVRGNSDLRSEAGAAQSLLERELQVAGWRVRQLLAHALPAFQLVLELGRAERKARPRRTLLAPPRRPYPTSERSVSAGGHFRTHARLAGGQGLAVQSKVGSPDVALGGVRYTDPMNCVYSQVWAGRRLTSGVHWDLKRESVASELGKLFAQHGRTVPGFINRKELEAALQEPFVTQVLSSMEVPAMKTDILKLFDRMNQETSFAGRIQAEHMAEAVASMGGGWRVYGFFDVKHQVIGVKNEVQIKAELAAKDASEQRRELHELDKKSRQLVQEVQRDVASVREELSVVKGQISKVLVKMEEQSAWLEQEKRDRISTTADMQEKINVLTTQTAAFSGISGKVDVIAAQVASQSTLQGKMDALSVQVATQAMVGAKVEALLGQVSAQMVALHTDKKVDDRLLEDRDVKPAEPAAEPESSFVTEAAASAEERSRSPKNADWLEAAHPGEATPSPSGGKTEDWATFPPMSGDDKPEQD